MSLPSNFGSLPLAAVALLGLSGLAHSQSTTNAVRLDGITARGAAAGVGGLVPNSTWEAWVRIPQYDPNFATEGMVLSRWGMWTSAAPVVCAADGRCSAVSGYGNPGDGYAPGINLSPGVWHHLATVFGPNPAPGYDFYVDGQLVQSVSPGGYVPSLGWETDLGCWGYGSGYSGFLKADVDEARLSNVPRYSGNFIPTPLLTVDASTVALWHFDEGSGNIAHDATGHGFDFTLFGGFSWVDGVVPPVFTNYCSAKMNSQGCVPSINAVGSVSLTGPDNLSINASGILNDTGGMLLWGTNPANTPFHGGTLCIATPILRTPLQNAGHAGAGPCGGSYSFFFSHAYAASQFLQPGTQICAQYYSRDPGFAAPNNVGLTDGVSFFLTP